jgi:hypothetical protein
VTQGFDLFINGGAAQSPWTVTLRLVLALVLGGVVTWLYKATRHTPVESSFRDYRCRVFTISGWASSAARR